MFQDAAAGTGNPEVMRTARPGFRRLGQYRDSCIEWT